MLQNGTHPQPSGVAALAKKPATTPTATPTRPGGAPYHIPSQLGQTRPTGHMASAAPQNGAPRPFNPSAPAHGLPRMGVFPTNMQRPVPGGQPGNMQQNRPGAPASINGSMIRPGMPIRANGSGPSGGNGVGQVGNGTSSGSGGPLNGHNSGVSAFARPAVGQIPPHRPGQHIQNPSQSNQNQNGQRPANLQMSGFPPLRPPQSQGSNQNHGTGVRSPPLSNPTQHNAQAQKSPVVPNEPAVQRGRDAVLFAAVETMDL